MRATIPVTCGLIGDPDPDTNSDARHDLFRQIGFDERIHKEESLLRMGEPRFR
jgi:hypothetical protein